MSSHKSTPCALPVALSVVLALLASGCAGDGSGSDSGSSFGDAASSAVREPALDLGADWDDAWIDDLGKPGRAETAAAMGVGAAQAGLTGTRRSYWAIVLKSFSAVGHREAAANMVRSSTQIDPRLGQSHVHTTEQGSVVVFGVYEKSSSPDAQRDLKWIKNLTLGDRPVFPRAILSRLTVGPDPDRMNPLSLMYARRKLPKVNPLYTLDVAVWGDFGSGKISSEELRRRGADYAQQLRAQGHEAYFYYDDNTNLCMVTVGLYDHSAIDAQSGLLAPEVEANLRKFPVRMVNGEPLNEPIDTRRPHLGTRLQVPQLVLVPK